MQIRLLPSSSVLSLLILAISAGVTAAQPAHRINAESYAKIRRGMTEKEIEGIFGVPFGQYTTGKVSCVIQTMTIAIQHSSYRLPDYHLSSPGGLFQMPHKAWIGNEIGIWVYFDEDGRVLTTRCSSVIPAEPDLLEWIRTYGLGSIEELSRQFRFGFVREN